MALGLPDPITSGVGPPECKRRVNYLWPGRVPSHVQHARISDDAHEAAMGTDGSVAASVEEWRERADMLDGLRLLDGDEVHLVWVNDHGQVVPRCGKAVDEQEVVGPAIAGVTVGVSDCGACGDE